LLTLPLACVACAAVAILCASAVAASTTRSSSHAAVSVAFCNKVGATRSAVHRIFHKATPSDYKGTSETYCQITPAKAPTTGSVTGCAAVECTDVFILGPKSKLASEVTYQVAELKRFGGGHVSQRAVAGAGSGAVLVTDTKYGDPTEGLGPVLFLGAGSDTVTIQGSLGGKPNFSEWEKLAHAVHVHLG
jgi:hypothetical protein